MTCNKNTQNDDQETKQHSDIKVPIIITSASSVYFCFLYLLGFGHN